MRIFGVAAGVLAFGALYLALISGFSQGAERYLAVLPGAIVVALCLVFYKTKYFKLITAGVLLLYTVLCIAIGFNAFYNGMLSFINSIAYAANNNMHWGLISFPVDSSAAGEFLFSSVLSVWLAYVTAVLLQKNSLIFIAASCVLTVVWLCLGLFPASYALILLAASFVCVFIVRSGMTAKSALCYVLCAVVLLACAVPCFTYKGNSAVSGVRESLSSAFDELLYGKDSLPEGKLLLAGNLHAEKDDRLKVTLTSDTPNLYLKGFVGGELENNVWKTTDKNAYVQNNYQGLLEYVAADGLPTMQYAVYSALNGKRGDYAVDVENVGASRKYVYAPYSINGYSAGARYYDLNLRSNIFTPRSYSYSVFGGDGSCEQVTQASWLLDGGNRTEERNAYLLTEGQYRAFVYDVYDVIDDETKNAIYSSFVHVDTDSINTVTQLIHDYFTNSYEYSSLPDPVENDFISEFFGGKIKRGNAVYFATAATYVFRYYGFAARYVEGYLARSQITSGTETLTLTSRDAHAWTEVYFDGIGWLPIEVTPTVFSDEVDPENPETPISPKPVPPEEPDTPPDTEEPDPEKPPVDEPDGPKSEEEKNLLSALKIVVPILGAVLIILAVMLAFVVRRRIIIDKKRKKLSSSKENFGRAAYSVAERDCKYFGGFNVETLNKFGIETSSLKRFTEIVEKSVYGETSLSLNEEKYLTAFLKELCSVLSNGKFIRRLVCKYALCLGI